MVCLSRPYSPAIFLKAIFHKFYFAYSWILCPKSCKFYQCWKMVQSLNNKFNLRNFSNTKVARLSRKQDFKVKPSHNNLSRHISFYEREKEILPNIILRVFLKNSFLAEGKLSIITNQGKLLSNNQQHYPNMKK